MRAIALLLLTSSTASAAAQSEFERLLVPLYVPASAPVEGAYGSRWATDVVIRNEGDVPAIIYQNLCVYECRPPIPTTACSAGMPTPAGQRFAGLIAGDQFGPNKGVFMHFERGAPVSVSARLVELSRGTIESGVEIPIVREHDLIDATTWLNNVPSQPDRSRVHLRVYFVSAPVADAAVRVRVYHGESAQAAADFVVRAIVSPFVGMPSAEVECVETPAFNMVDLTPHLSRSGGAVRARIDSLTPELRYWPMISVTSNSTQFVTIVTPQ